ncbi:hypothetical protein ACM64Y_18770 [Novispirillum sp. DQ9]|uniref:hypothetical protein n=1 Tax=Novispirillum sp. DQ9 TaxID=3398612 RepID=UPI003C7DB469
MFFLLVAGAVTLAVAGLIALLVAMEHGGITGGWTWAGSGLLLGGIAYPVLAVVAWKKARAHAEPRGRLAWSLAPAPLLGLMALLLVVELYT